MRFLRKFVFNQNTPFNKFKSCFVLASFTHCFLFFLISISSLKLLAEENKLAPESKTQQSYFYVVQEWEHLAKVLRFLGFENRELYGKKGLIQEVETYHAHHSATRLNAIYPCQLIYLPASLVDRALQNQKIRISPAQEVLILRDFETERMEEQLARPYDPLQSIGSPLCTIDGRPYQAPKVKFPLYEGFDLSAETGVMTYWQNGSEAPDHNVKINLLDAAAEAHLRLSMRLRNHWAITPHLSHSKISILELDSPTVSGRHQNLWSLGIEVSKRWPLKRELGFFIAEKESVIYEGLPRNQAQFDKKTLNWAGVRIRESLGSWNFFYPYFQIQLEARLPWPETQLWSDDGLKAITELGFRYRRWWPFELELAPQLSFQKNPSTLSSTEFFDVGGRASIRFFWGDILPIKMAL